MTRLNLVVALPCEARPWVEHFRLKAVSGAPFRIWRNDGIALVISGIGSMAASAACGYLAGLTNASRTCVWINAGIAGHASLSRGTLLRVDKCINKVDGSVFYPSLPVSSTLAATHCVTVDCVESEFSSDAVYDMESSGFFAAASRFSFLDLVHALKVVSDNRTETTADLDRTAITNLIADRIVDMDEGLIQPLLQCASVLAEEATTVDLTPFLSQWHFSVSNEQRLRDVINDWCAVHAGACPELALVGDCRGATEVICRLRDMLDAPAPVQIRP